MKKIIPGIILGIFLVGLLSPGVILAQKKPNDCCKIGHTFTIDTETYAKGDIVGAPTAENPWCDVNRDGTPDTIKTQRADWGMICLINTLHTITNWIFILLMIVAVLMIVFGGFTYITAAGDPEKAGKGKQILTLSIIGIALALIAKIVPSVVRFFMGM